MYILSYTETGLLTLIYVSIWLILRKHFAFFPQKELKIYEMKNKMEYDS